MKPLETHRAARSDQLRILLDFLTVQTDSKRQALAERLLPGVLTKFSLSALESSNPNVPPNKKRLTVPKWRDLVENANQLLATINPALVQELLHGQAALTMDDVSCPVPAPVRSVSVRPVSTLRPQLLVRRPLTELDQKILRSIADGRDRPTHSVLLARTGANSLSTATARLQQAIQRIELQHERRVDDFAVRHIRVMVKSTFDQIIALEKVDLHQALHGRKRRPFFCTDSSMDTLHSSAWDSLSSFQSLLTNARELSKHFRFTFHRYVRVFVIADPSTVPFTHARLNTLQRMVAWHLKAEIGVGFLPISQLPPGQVDCFVNMYLVPGEVVLFGDQPIPYTARFDRYDNVGRQMISKGEMFRQFILETLTKGSAGLYFNRLQSLSEIQARLNDYFLPTRP